MHAATTPWRSHAPLRPHLLLMATGGTIAMTVDRSIDAPVPAWTGADLLRAVPGLAEIACLRVTDLFNIPSVEMGPSRWHALRGAIAFAVEQHDIDGVIVSHGTDTLEESAWFLDLTLRTDKPIVLVGAQRNASEADFDGPDNLLDAARLCRWRCRSPQAPGLGVVVVMNGEVHAAREVTKWHTTDLAGFHSTGPGRLGTVDANGVVIRRCAPSPRPHFDQPSPELPRVEIVPAFAGADGWLIRAAIDQGARGIVVQALGAGNVTGLMHAAIGAAVRAGIPVVITTRVPAGRVHPIYGFPGGGKTLDQAGAILAGDLNPQKARILLMLALQTTRDPVALRRLFSG